MFFNKKVQHGGNEASFSPPFHRNDRVFDTFLRQLRPVPQTLRPIYPMLGQNGVKTVKNCQNDVKTVKNSKNDKVGLLRSRKVSLLLGNPNMATNSSLYLLVFKTKEAWWTAPVRWVCSRPWCHREHGAGQWVWGCRGHGVGGGVRGMGYGGMGYGYWAWVRVLNRIEPYWATLSRNGPHWAVLGHIEPYWATLSHIELYWAILSHI